MACSSSSPAAAQPRPVARPSGNSLVLIQSAPVDLSAFPDSHQGELNYLSNRAAYEKNFPALSEGQLERKREEFFDTRNEGRQEMWAAIKLACSAENEETSSLILQAAGLSGWQSDKGESAFSYDQRGFRYEVPFYCLINPSAEFLEAVLARQNAAAHPPVSPLVGEDEKSADPKDSKLIAFKLRFSNGSVDFPVSLRAGTRVRELRAIAERERKIPSAQLFAVFYQGRILADQETLRSAKVKEGFVVQIMMRTTPGGF